MSSQVVFDVSLEGLHNDCINVWILKRNYNLQHLLAAKLGLEFFHYSLADLLGIFGIRGDCVSETLHCAVHKSLGDGDLLLLAPALVSMALIQYIDCQCCDEQLQLVLTAALCLRAAGG